MVFLGYVLALDILPFKYFLPFAIILLLLFAGPYVAQMFKRTRNPFKVLSLILSIMMIYIQVVYFVPLGNVLKNISGSDTVTDIMNVYVLKDDKAEKLKDMKEYSFGYIKDSDNSTLSADTIKKINKELESEINGTEYESYVDAVEALFGGKVQALILNKAYVDIITDEETYANMESDMKDNFKNFQDLTRVIKSISFEVKVEPDKYINVTNDPFCIYLSGIDVYGDISTTSRSDVNILAFINPKTKQVLLLNTPRDSYVYNPHSGNMKDKLTHAAIYGIDSSMWALEKLYGQDIDYFFRVNFSGFEKIIISLGGINVYSEFAFTAKHGGYTYTKGYNRLNGKEALSFCRERYAFSAGDRQRGKNQMAVITALIDELASSKLLSNYSSVMRSIDGTFETSLSQNQISDLIKMQLNNMSSWNVKNYSADGKGGMEYTYTSPKSKRSIIILDETTVEKAKVLIKQVYDGEIINLDAVK